MSALKKALDSLLTERDPQKSLQNDPLSFVHRYEKTEDQEIAAVFAAQLAYGRVSSFFGVASKSCHLRKADHTDLHFSSNWADVQKKATLLGIR